MLSAKKGKTTIMKEADIAKLPTPKATATWQPVPHIELIKTLKSVLADEGMKVLDGQYGIAREGARIFGVMNLEHDLNGGIGGASLGFRHSNDKKMSIQIVAGMSVFVCDNMVLRGDLIALKRKHTSGLDLRTEIVEAVSKFKVHLVTLESEVSRLQKENVKDVDAKALIHDAFKEELVPSRYFPRVSDAYFNPPHEEFAPRTMWSLHNAFTEVLKEMPLGRRMKATQEIGVLFGLTNSR